jgi:hypothetical protein
MKNEFVIADYCRQQLMNDTVLFNDYVNKKPCFIFSLIKEKNEFQYNINQLLCQQKIRNYFVSETVKKIYECQYDIVGIKGLFLQGVYYDSPYIRLYNDIDLLARPDNCVHIMKFLLKNGFTIAPSRSLFDNSLFGAYIFGKEYFTRACHIVLYKPLNNGANILIELHGNLNKCASGNLNFDVINMINNSIKKEINGITVKTLCPSDNLIYIMFHTIKHLSYISFSKNPNKMINLQSFFDVAQIITREKIAWQSFLNNSIKYNILPFIALFSYIFNDIFPNLIPQIILDEILYLTTKKEFVWKPIYYEVRQLKPKDIILGNLKEIEDINSLYNRCKFSASSKTILREYCKQKKGD